MRKATATALATFVLAALPTSHAWYERNEVQHGVEHVATQTYHHHKHHAQYAKEM